MHEQGIGGIIMFDRKLGNGGVLGNIAKFIKQNEELSLLLY